MPNDYNAKVIEEFRASGGKLGGPFEGAPVLLLHSTGAKSGQERVNPMMYRAVGNDYAVFASKAGAPTNPDWYHNLLAHPRASIEIDDKTVEVTARLAGADERAPIWEGQKTDYPGFAEYEAKTDRVIPVMILKPVGS
jgi:deazaflavin-dependent oxidoreductase (nitroreductase family)